MRRIPKKWLFLVVLLISLTVHGEKKKFVILTASYNNEQWLHKNLDSIFGQKYDSSYWRVIYINDCSSDNTGQLVEEYVAQHGYHDQITIIQNEKRRRHLANQYDAIHHLCKSNEIIVICDGDDWFAHPFVLHYLNEIYQDADVWLTWGQFWYWHRDRLGCSRKIPQHILQENRVREHRPWVTSHLRTFYAGLFKQIKFEDLLYEGQFFPMCADTATMMPMIEMAGTRIKFIPDILYIYNDVNSLSFYHNHAEKQRKLENIIRSRQRYQPLSYAVFF